jgi:hypothetical protein
MDNMSWVTSWEAWRAAMGRQNPKQRAAVDKFLETRPCLMYWGDSWFSTMLYLNLARQSALRINGMGILVGKPGATAQALFSPAQVRDKMGRLEAWPFDVVCLSAGGNDALSERLEKVFQPWMKKPRASKITPDKAYELLLASNVFPGIEHSYRNVLDGFAKLTKKKGKQHIRVIGHTYTRLKRIGAPADLTVGNIGLIALLKGEVGPWLWSVMKHVLADEAAGAKFADLLLADGFKGVLDKLAADPKYAPFFSVVDLSSAPEGQQDSFWNDEIHPGEAGFAILAKTLNQEIRRVLPAAKRAAVS